MDLLPDTTELADTLHYSYFLDLYDVPKDGFNPIFDNSSSTIPDLTYPFDDQYNFPL
jgi:hypothetical protein